MAVTGMGWRGKGRLSRGATFRRGRAFSEQDDSKLANLSLIYEEKEYFTGTILNEDWFAASLELVGVVWRNNWKTIIISNTALIEIIQLDFSGSERKLHDTDA